MKDGFIKIACISPKLKVADCRYNSDKITEAITNAYNSSVKICSFPELSITGYTCGDLFLQSSLLNEAESSVIKIAEDTKSLDIISIVGFPCAFMNSLYNCAAVIYKGDILGIVPKSNIPNYSEFYEARHFAQGIEKIENMNLKGKIVPFGINQIFQCEEMPEFTFGVEICEDLWVGTTPSVKLTESGATMIFNLSASDEIIGKADYRRTIVKAKSGSLLCIYAYTDAGIGESTTDMVFSGHNIIAENGKILSESSLFENGMITADTDVLKTAGERWKSNTCSYTNNGYTINKFSMQPVETKLTRKFSRFPFVPSSKSSLDNRCTEILNIQSVGLMSRLKHIKAKNAVLGLSGGLDSTLALIVTVKAFKMLNLDTENITAVTMPCFGTTDRTYQNACRLADAYNVTLREVNIRTSVLQHFKDIGHDESNHDVTYENSQARERTQVLMDIANQSNGIVIGTGDLSELALGWATYNGDHMSMYAVNTSIPKTLVRHLVQYYADTCEDQELKEVLLDVLDTPVSPELLPPKDGEIAQKTEDLVGPYELHDFYLYYVLRFGFEPSKIYRLAKLAFEGTYDSETIMKWLKTFYRRFFAQQFKRSCLPDGPKIGTVALSPRGDWRMPSDACAAVWMQDLEALKK